MFRYDLHVHTAEHSACAVSSAEEMCRTALERGLSGIALTDHDVWWPDDEIETLRAKFPSLVILAGAEAALEEGHFLVFVRDRAIELPFPGDIVELTDEVHDADGIVLWAHPFRYDPAMPRWLSRVSLDGIEVASSNMNGKTSERAAALARERRLPPFRNSDAHHADRLGMFRNDLRSRVVDEGCLIRAVRNGFEGCG
jgi:predicted metal-dependent phosphoesterase TrpH